MYPYVRFSKMHKMGEMMEDFTILGLKAKAIGQARVNFGRFA
jgi:hypothetical protein